MGSPIPSTDDTGVRTWVRMYTTLATLRIDVGRRTLRMTGLADRVREATGT